MRTDQLPIDGKKFADRRSAGILLGRLLEKQYKDRNVLVLGIPRGGIIVAAEVARILNGELAAVITKKLPHPRLPEMAIGAAAEDGSTYLNAMALDVERDALKQIIESQLTEIRNRTERFRNGKPLPPMYNRIVIVVDDGIATGSTIVSAIKLCKNLKAARVIAAVPVSGKKYLADIDQLADEVIVTEKPENFFSVGQVYHDFHPVSDTDVIKILNEMSRNRNRF